MLADTVRPVLESEISDWDLTADVVVAGYGIAGVAAAVEAARAGAEVLVLERSGGWGGAASMAGGFIYLGGRDTATEGMWIRRLGREHESVHESRTRSVHRRSEDRCLLRRKRRPLQLARGSRGAVQGGILGRTRLGTRPRRRTDVLRGGENAAPFKDMIPPAPRGHLPPGWTTRGPGNAAAGTC